MFSQYKSCDNTLKSCFYQISSHSSAYLRIIYEKTKGQDPLWPLLGKQYIQAKEVYLDVIMRMIDSLIEEGKPVKPTVCWDKFSHVHMGKQCKTGWYYPREVLPYMGNIGMCPCAGYGFYTVYRWFSLWHHQIVKSK